ncbi:hypothetical protein [Streptomyces sp. NPDC051310]|uniref:hypothetical protein n=1 Tax=Streptomyces sp. NPDC051310 TaxID=3365649 RepID=UPI0037AF579F
MSAPAPAPSRSAGHWEVVLRITLPDLPACTTMLGAALVHSAVPAAPPLVVPALGAMAYDTGLWAVRRRDG